MSQQTATEKVQAMTPEERDRAARSILESPLYTHTFDRLEHAFTDAIKDSDPSEVESREDAYRAIRTLRELRRSIAMHMKTERLTVGGGKS